MAELVPLQMASAVVSLGHGQEGWELHQAPDGSKSRSFDYEVSFAQSFAAAPVVHVGLSGFDVGNEDAARLRVSVVEAHPAGFTLRVETWLHTRVWGVDVSWLAVGS